jgi:hypothetical protein
MDASPDAGALPLIQAAGFSHHNYAAFSIPVPLISPQVAGVAFIIPFHKLSLCRTNLVAACPCSERGCDGVDRLHRP